MCVVVDASAVPVCDTKFLKSDEELGVFRCFLLLAVQQQHLVPSGGKDT